MGPLSKASPLSAPFGFVGTAKEHGKDKVNHAIAGVRKEFVTWSKRKVLKVLEALVDKIPLLLKEVLDDPDMPIAVKLNVVDTAVDKLWPLMRQEIMWEAMVYLDRSPHAEKDALSKEKAPNRILAYLRYSLLPYNKRKFGTLRQPVSLIFNILLLFPMAGVPSFVYLGYFLVIDRSDKYQLIYFMLCLKYTTFFTQGLLKSLLGFFLYFQCVTFVALGPAEYSTGASLNTLRLAQFPFLFEGAPEFQRFPAEDQHRCAERGPGWAFFYPLTVAGVLLEVSMVWVAWLLVPHAMEKGRRTLGSEVFDGDEHHDDDAEPVDKYEFLRWLIFYDFVCFGSVATLFVVVSILMGWMPGSWPARQLFFVCEVIKGFLSFPWFFFGLPGLTGVLIPVKATYYDERGLARTPDMPRGDRMRHRHNAELAKQKEEGDEAWVPLNEFSFLIDSFKDQVLDGPPVASMKERHASGSEDSSTSAGAGGARTQPASLHAAHHGRAHHGHPRTKKSAGSQHEAPVRSFTPPGDVHNHIGGPEGETSKKPCLKHKLVPKRFRATTGSGKE